ncbi:unnamed protein product [Rotaria magnacalcarata]|uniref:Uncharacterized protein n=1 Tax=Rotaria magnacalcarata TaxID=392030 RepID=A0A816KK27_9BILA|nr:unnamed protein product [Rotaria magnacalcarata]CAF4082723.1 unnamed protein product [Rotaria magnacalcarata]
MPSDEQSRKVILIALGITAVFGIITFALAAAILGGQNKRFSNIDWSLEELTKTVNKISEQLSSNTGTSGPSTGQPTTTTTGPTTTTPGSTTTTPRPTTTSA